MVAKLGLLIVGASGANGRAIRSALEMFAKSERAPDFGVSSLPIFDQQKFPRAADFVVAGWDVRSATETRLVPDRVTRAMFGEFDTSLGDEESEEFWHDAKLSVEEIGEQIEDFKSATSVDQIIVLNLSSPPRRMATPLAGLTVDEVLRSSSDELPSSVLYALAAVQSGADYIDFTPSETLEWIALRRLSTDFRVQLAGRDGATGQTFLKLLISSALEMRGLHVKNWYSTNILGNRDGAALVLPGVDETKQADKAFGLNQFSNIAFPDHQIDIRYMPELGDVKEAWDSVVLEDFLGNDVELRLNWRGLDSPLAAQMALDIVRFVAAGRAQGRYGPRSDLGMFFKHPIAGDVRSPATLFDRLVAGNADLLIEGKSRDTLPF